ncbi:signal peptidase I [Streptomyces abyssomicinicus]|uniref:signal peptidase I n=1 Tax=Streptomyces abyssomicinicus TaxID=574929 RepID=UPI001583A182|nr:signal peptidase I [Streptomyces abyssomicinicus]
MRRAARPVVAGVVTAAMGAALFGGCLVRTLTGYGSATVSSAGMEPAYGPGDRLVYERIDGDTDGAGDTEGAGGAGGGLRRGDVVLVLAPERYGPLPVVSRVVGVGGERVACCGAEGGAKDGAERVTVDGRELAEPYVKDGIAHGGGLPPYEVTVPGGRVFLLGDHRENARDSRAFLDDRGGTLPVDAVRGRIVPASALAGLLGGMLAGLVPALAGAGLWIAGAVARRRAAPVATPSEWAALL